MKISFTDNYKKFYYENGIIRIPFNFILMYQTHILFLQLIISHVVKKLRFTLILIIIVLFI